VYQPPAYTPDLNPLEGIWPVFNRGVLANLAVASFGHLYRSSGTAGRRFSPSPASSRGASPEPGWPWTH